MFANRLSRHLTQHRLSRFLAEPARRWNRSHSSAAFVTCPATLASINFPQAQLTVYQLAYERAQAEVAARRRALASQWN